MSHSGWSSVGPVNITVAGTVPSAVPLTFSIWYKATTIGAGNRHLIDVLKDTSNYFAIRVDTATPRVMTTVGGTPAQANGPSNITTGQWYNIVGVIASTTSRTCYLDGVAGTTNTTSATVTSAVSGKIGYPGVGGEAAGSLAEAAIWNVALSAEDAAALAYTSPLLIRPDALVSYVPLLASGTLDFMASAATVSGSLTKDNDHPRVIYARRSKAFDSTTGGPATTSLTLSPASFAYTPSSLSVPTKRLLTLSPASFAYSAQDLGATTNRLLALSPASFAFTANDLSPVYVPGTPPAPAAGDNLPTGGGGRKTLPYGWWREKLEDLELLKEGTREALKDADEDGQVGQTASLVESIVNPFKTEGRIDWARLIETSQQLNELKTAVAEYEEALAEQEDEEALLMLL